MAKGQSLCQSRRVSKLKLRRVSHVITLQAVELLLPRIDYDYLTDAPQRMLRGQPRQRSKYPTGE